jgi:hypothetical protein
LLASIEARLRLQLVDNAEDAIIATVYDCKSNSSWTLTRVYGPQEDLVKKMFLRHLKRIKQIAKLQWLIIGDFNLIYKDQDKNNCRINRRMMKRVRRTLNPIIRTLQPYLGLIGLFAFQLGKVFAIIPFCRLYLHQALIIVLFFLCPSTPL